MSFDPRPIDADHIEIPPDLAVLVERLAENVHSIWADQRMRDGWKYGPARDDLRKEHPCLVPFAQLPEAEKVYDRRIVTDTLKALLALGYGIEKTLDE